MRNFPGKWIYSTILAEDARRPRLEWVGFVLADFKTRNRRLVYGTAGEGDHDLAAAVGRGRERLDHSDVFSSGCGKLVKVGEHRGAVDGHVELTIPRRGEVYLGEVNQDGVLAVGHHARNRVGEGSVTLGLIHRHRRRIGAGRGGANGVRGRGGSPAAGEVHIGNKGSVAAARVAHRRTFKVDGDEVTGGRRSSVADDRRMR